MFRSLNCHHISTSAALFGLLTEHSKCARLPRSATSVLWNSVEEVVSIAADDAGRRRTMKADAAAARKKSERENKKKEKHVHYSTIDVSVCPIINALTPLSFSRLSREEEI